MSIGTLLHWGGGMAENSKTLKQAPSLKQAPKTSPIPTCYHFKFSSSASKGVCINRREPNTGER